MIQPAADGKSAGNKPVFSARKFGVEVAIFKRDDNLSITFRKSYKDKNGKWQNTNFYNSGDLTNIKSLLRQAEQFIIENG